MSHLFGGNKMKNAEIQIVIDVITQEMGEMLFQERAC